MAYSVSRLGEGGRREYIHGDIESAQGRASGFAKLPEPYAFGYGFHPEKIAPQMSRYLSYRLLAMVSVGYSLCPIGAVVV